MINARGLWSAEIAYRYGIRPWEMTRLTLAEVDGIRRHHDQLAQAAQAAEDQGV